MIHRKRFAAGRFRSRPNQFKPLFAGRLFYFQELSMLTVWELITDYQRIRLLSFQHLKYGTILDLFDEEQKAHLDYMPKERELQKFIAEAPKHQVYVK
jgi:hypothetical protein